ncbi:MAG: hypothetical protein IJR25_02055 [Bacteroidales bacterium]|nr:hypothetical protein [Bacteroidales bacterium]
MHNTETPSDGTQTSLGKEMCITGAVGNTFSGNSNSHFSSIRVNQTGRRINPSPKTTSRLVRTGKIIDTHNFNPFLSALFPKTDGVQSLFRYIYSICCLRL